MSHLSNYATDPVKLTAKLVGIDSTDPGAFEAEIEHFLYSWLQQRIPLAGSLADRITLQELEVTPGRTCLRIFIPSETDDATADQAPADLTLMGHMDTVRIGDGWSEDTPALTPTIQGTRLYGRGSCDMKSGLASALCAIEHALIQIGHTKRLPQHSLALIGTVDEEDIMRGSEAAIAKGWLGHDGWVLDHEPTSGTIRGAHKGRTWYNVHIQGITAHASTPEQGADAIAAMACFIECLRTRFATLPTHAALGHSTLVFGQVKGGYSPYVVPDTCDLTIDMRLVPPASTVLADTFVQEALSAAEKSVPGVKGSFVCTGDRPPIEAHEDSGLLLAMKRACKDAGYGELGEQVFTGYTDTAVVAGQCNNPNCFSYGPGELELAHKPNEYVETADIYRVCDVLTALIDNLM